MQATIETPIVKSTVKPEFGKGPFSVLMEDQYSQVQDLFKLSSEKAEKYARQLASDLGAIQRSMQFSVKGGKPDKDALRKIAMSAKSGKIAPTPAMQVLFALQWIELAGQNNVSYGLTKWTLTPMVQEWVDKL